MNFVSLFTARRASKTAAVPGLEQAFSEPGSSDGERRLHALAERLRNAAALPSNRAGDVRAAALDCAGELAQLKALWRQQADQATRLGHELQQARSALGRARSQRADTPSDTPSDTGSNIPSDTDTNDRRQRADHDALTLLPNQAHLHARLQEMLGTDPAQRAPLALLMLNLDGFQTINERHGPEAGDGLLRIVARRLRLAVRADDLVCRLGDDEFACLLINVLDAEQLCRVACKLFDTVSAPVSVGSLSLSVRPSIGIAMGPTDGNTATLLLHNADAAMHRAKRLQTGYAIFDRHRDGSEVSEVQDV